MIKADRTIQHSIYAAAKSDATKLAFSLDDKVHMTYGELLSRAESLSSYLVARTSDAIDNVAIMLPRSLETPVSLYAVLMSGNAFIPIDPGLPIDRIKWILEESNVKILISDASLAFKLQSLTAVVDYVVGSTDTEACEGISWQDIYELPADEASEGRGKSEDVAYIMFTSGTTGTPKGIVHTHSSCLAYAQFSMDLFAITNEDSSIIHAPLHFDICTLGYFTLPLAGGHSTIMSDQSTMFPLAALSMLLEQKPTIWYSVPKALYLLMDTDRFSTRSLPSLRHIIYAGEPANKKYLQRLVEFFPKSMITNVYGPTETNQCTSYRIPKGYKAPEEVPIGNTWSGASWRIEDENMQESQKGELLIASDTLMKGYYLNDTLTQKSIVSRKSARGLQNYYKTGDLVSYNEKDGLLYFHGRNDRQIKINGYRIELDEIQKVLNSHAHVSESVTIVDKSTETARLVAFYVSDTEQEEKELRRFVALQVPAYAVPSVFVWRQDLPRTTRGKLDYTALRGEITFE